MKGSFLKLEENSPQIVTLADLLETQKKRGVFYSCIEAVRKCFSCCRSNIKDKFHSFNDIENQKDRGGLPLLKCVGVSENTGERGRVLYAARHTTRKEAFGWQADSQLGAGMRAESIARNAEENEWRAEEDKILEGTLSPDEERMYKKAIEKTGVLAPASFWGGENMECYPSANRLFPTQHTVPQSFVRKLVLPNSNGPKHRGTTPPPSGRIKPASSPLTHTMPL